MSEVRVIFIFSKILNFLPPHYLIIIHLFCMFQYYLSTYCIIPFIHKWNPFCLILCLICDSTAYIYLQILISSGILPHKAVVFGWEDCIRSSLHIKKFFHPSLYSKIVYKYRSCAIHCSTRLLSNKIKSSWSASWNCCQDCM